VLAEEAQQLHPRASFGVTKFSDLTPEEFARRHGLLSSSKPHKPSVPLFTNEEIAARPTSFDWRDQGALTPVKDQKHCGSCWAFSTTGNIEAQTFIATGKLPNLSEQELVSCDFDDGGCQGGLMDQAFTFLRDERSGEIVTESYYPYVSSDGITRGCGGDDGKYTLCRGKGGAASDAWCTQFCYDKMGKALCTPDQCDCSSTGQHVGAKITGYEDLPSDEDQLSTWLAQHGPISIGVCVPLGTVWQGYTGGILDSTACPPNDPNHGVLLVGYDLSEKYWVVKNSWGADFGEQGYIRLAYGTNTCSLTRTPSTSKVVSVSVV